MAGLTRVGSQPLKVWAALATLYVVWGANFLAIALTVRTLPPLLGMSVRHLIAGGVLLTWPLLRARGAFRMGREQWRAAVVFGAALFLVGHGGLAWAQQTVPSGVAALLVGSIPLWMAAIDRVAFARRLAWPTVVGLVVGFAGVALLVDPAGGEIDRAGALVALVAALAWAAGSLYSQRAPLPSDPLLAAGAAMAAGGVLLGVAGVAGGELSDVDLARVSGESLAGLAYMIVFASLVGFSAYVWLLRVAPTSLVSTYAYANPVVAVLLGWAVLGEAITPRVLLAGAAIVAAVALIVSAREGKQAAREPARELAGARR